MENIKKIEVANGWLEYPKNKPKIGEEIVVCYGERGKKEVVMWEFKYVNNAKPFKWFRLPKINKSVKS